MEDSLGMSISAEEKIMQLEAPVVRMLKPSPIDGTNVTRCICGSTFRLMLRQHHCRSCGQVFCWVCTNQRIIIPALLVEYRQTTGWWQKGIPARVCKKCYDRVVLYQVSQVLIDQLYLRPISLERLYVMSLQNGSAQRAVEYYITDMKRTKYLFPSEGLSPSQIGFLRANANFLSHDQLWMTQILKVETLENADISLKQAVDIIIFAKVYGSSIDHALKVIDTVKITEIISYIPILTLTFDAKVFTILIKRSCESQLLAFVFYWSLNILSSSVCNGETATSYRENLLMKLSATNTKDEERSKGIVNFRRFICSFEQGINLVKTVINDFSVIDPLHPDHQITHVEKIEPGESHSRPFFISYKSSFDPLQTFQIMYKREDTRKDACIVKIIRLLAETLVEIRDPFPLVTYAVMPISPRAGFVEIVEEARTIFSISKEGSINNFFQKHAPAKIMGDIREVYTLSLAFWTIITYIFGVGDRHLDNIMISTSGVLFHIDYGFIFGADPKPYAPRVRLNSYMIEGIGGDSEYEDFKERCCKIFMIIRQHDMEIYTFLLELVMADPKISDLESSEEGVREHLSNVFFIGESDQDVKKNLYSLIDASRDSYGASFGEYIHGAAKTTSKLVGRFMSSSPPM